MRTHFFLNLSPHKKMHVFFFMDIILTLFLANECPEFIMQRAFTIFLTRVTYNGEPQITVTFLILRERGK